jgi:hypothetical protein
VEEVAGTALLLLGTEGSTKVVAPELSAVFTAEEAAVLTTLTVSLDWAVETPMEVEGLVSEVEVLRVVEVL